MAAVAELECEWAECGYHCLSNLDADEWADWVEWLGDGREKLRPLVPEDPNFSRVGARVHNNRVAEVVLHTKLPDDYVRIAQALRRDGKVIREEAERRWKSSKNCSMRF